MLENIKKLAQAIQKSFDIPDSEKQIADEAIIALKKVSKALAEIDNHLDIIYEPFSNHTSISPKSANKHRGVIHRYKQKSKENFSEFKELAYIAIKKIEYFEVGDITIQDILSSFNEAVESLAHKAEDFFATLGDYKSPQFRENVINSIDLIKNELDLLIDLIKDRVIDHIEENILVKSWTNEVSESLDMTFEEAVPLITELFNERQELLKKQQPANKIQPGKMPSSSKKQQAFNPSDAQKMWYPDSFPRAASRIIELNSILKHSNDKKKLKDYIKKRGEALEIEINLLFNGHDFESLAVFLDRYEELKYNSKFKSKESDKLILEKLFKENKNFEKLFNYNNYNSTIDINLSSLGIYISDNFLLKRFNQQQLANLFMSGKIDSSNVNLSNLSLYITDCNNVDFSGSNLSNSYLYDCDLTGCNFKNCIINGVDFSHSTLTNTNFDGVKGAANFDWSSAKDNKTLLDILKNISNGNIYQILDLRHGDEEYYIRNSEILAEERDEQENWVY